MREIKFRGKSNRNGEWVYGLPNYNSGGAIGRICGWMGEDGSEKYEEIEVIPETVGQFIGLYDKNKTEVYEGDIMSWIDNNPDDGDFPITAAFVYQRNNAQFRLDTTNYPPQYKKVRPEKMEIIGNVTDNPELLSK